ncbi:hypothetical protein RhiirC2_720911 [Rhizophagus irregularis]|uniref:Uncharacterized protein n=1 Tax=Rhizophagus irregularis TaxID=588596 RepID=A0A2N1M8F9_9GLOM|nr:hypothetical protein RhiirC2_720911 [Rhizophagus irregularis]
MASTSGISAVNEPPQTDELTVAKSELVVNLNPEPSRISGKGKEVERAPPRQDSQPTIMPARAQREERLRKKAIKLGEDPVKIEGDAQMCEYARGEGEDPYGDVCTRKTDRRRGYPPKIRGQRRNIPMSGITDLTKPERRSPARKNFAGATSCTTQSKNSPKMNSQLAVVGEESEGRVDYTIKCIKELIAITEGKQYQIIGFAQNVIQCESAYQTNKRKRKADDAFGGLRLSVLNHHHSHGLVLFPLYLREYFMYE